MSGNKSIYAVKLFCCVHFMNMFLITIFYVLMDLFLHLCIYVCIYAIFVRVKKLDIINISLLLYYTCLCVLVLSLIYINLCTWLNVYTLAPSLSLCVLKDLFIKPALCELLALVHQLEQLKILLWIYVACLDVLLHVHLW